MAGNNSVRQRQANGHASIPSKTTAQAAGSPDGTNSSSLVNLVICVGGIYASFLTWGVLQERITTTNYGTAAQREVFKYPVVMNTVQSFFAATLGYIYTIYSRRKSGSALPIIPEWSILAPLTLVAITSSLSSPFGYASLQYVDYITFILAKSCKLLPVMFLHVVLYRKKYPFSKYAVVALVTAGVAVFTLHESAGSKKKGSATGNSVYGLVLLSVNLLLDGLTNATQDNIHAKYKSFSGPQMMTALNTMSTILTSVYLLASPYLASTGMGDYLGMDLTKNAGELQGAIAFVQRHPSVGWDVLGFAACGAIGQVFIFQTLSIFGSLLLVTVTVTRKMLTMIISIVWFGHSLTLMQFLGIGLVFAGIGIEAQLSKREKAAKDAAKKKQ
ncbi:hypothetical protein AMS68_000992 [Peltaster fructicola]|uniref:UDP-galactose transporter homolog 1 n=1 Tax=Peltaster fructicola TaxID=286661 RepID=A0A6H0XLH2_9PEZI|nr:hypothetical protein AMS68_000992 [Peltaster fructicola]